MLGWAYQDDARSIADGDFCIREGSPGASCLVQSGWQSVWRH